MGVLKESELREACVIGFSATGQARELVRFSMKNGRIDVIRIESPGNLFDKVERSGWYP